MAKVGRPKGSTKPPTVNYHRRVRAEWVKILDELLKKLKGQKNDWFYYRYYYIGLVFLAYNMGIQNKSSQ